MALRDYIEAKNCESFELKHIDILASCLVQDLKAEEKEIWLEIYKNLQRNIFMALTEDEHCNLASGIIKKIFINKDLESEVLSVKNSSLIL